MSNAVFPALPGLKFDLVRSPQWSTQVQRSVGGIEMRGAFYTYPQYKWQLSYEVLRQTSGFAELDTIAAFFQQRQGAFDSFLYNDVKDNAVTAHGFGVGDSVTTAFQLQRAWTGSNLQDYWSGVQSLQSTVPRTNLLLYSEQFDNAAWTKQNASVTANVAVAPDLNATADFLKEDGTNSQHGCYQLVTTGAGTYTATVFAKASTRTKLWWGLTTQAEASTCYATYDLAAGTVSAVTNAGAGHLTNATANIKALPNGWYMLTMTATADGTVTSMGQFPRLVNGSGANSYAGDGISGLFIWGGDLKADAGSPYIGPTTSAAVTVTPNYWPKAGDGFEPIFNLNPATPLQVFRQDWQGNQLMYPTARTNLATYSEQLDNAAWTKTNATISANATAAPDTNTTADKIQETATTAQHYVQDASISIVNGVTYAATIFAKAAERSLAIFQGDAVGGKLGGTACFDLSAGTVSNIGAGITSATITPLPNGWWKLLIVATATGTSASPAIGPATSAGSGFPSYAGTAGNGIYAWGLDVKADTGSSYIGPTTAAAVTITDYAVNGSAVVTFANAPLTGAILTWTGAYYWRVRFAQDLADYNLFMQNLYELKKLELVSVK